MTSKFKSELQFVINFSELDVSENECNFCKAVSESNREAKMSIQSINSNPAYYFFNS